MKYICIGPHCCWGTGPTKQAAMNKCAARGPGMAALKRHYQIYLATNNSMVDEVAGGIRILSPSDHPAKLIEKK